MKRLCYKHSITLTLFASLLGGASLSAAEQSDRRADEYFAYARAGTLGLGVGAGYRWSERVTLRAGINSGGSESGSRKIDDIRYDRDLKMRHSAELLMDWYPFQNNGFRISAGIMTTSTRTLLTARSNAAGDYIINGNAYAAEEIGNLSAEVRPQVISPYLGAGWESRPLGSRGLRIAADAGLLHLRGRKATLVASGAIDDSSFTDDLAAEQKRIRNVNDLAFGLSIGLIYSF